MKNLMALGAFIVATGILLGAFGAHGLQKVVEEMAKIKTFEVGVRYQIYHGFAFIVLGLLGHCTSLKKNITSLVAGLWISGLGLFSGGCYLSSLGLLGKLHLLIPVGGLSYMVGWLILGIGLCRSNVR